MKIAFVGHKRIPSREGGIEVVVEELSTRMAALGNYVIAYSRRGHNVAGVRYDNKANTTCTPFLYKGVHVVPVMTFDIKGLAAISSSFFATLKAIHDRPDVIHYHAEGPCVPLWLAHKAGIRTIATIHGLDWQREKWGRLASWYLRLGERIAAQYADEVIVLSRSMQMYFNKTYGRDTHFIPNGVTRNECVNLGILEEKYGLQKKEYILFLGRIVPEKGVKYLVEAFRRIDTDKKLVIAGGASDSSEYYNLIQQAARKDDRIVLTGFVQGKELAALYSNAYIYVLPSDLEGMPMSLLEAMSYGNCCLVSDIPECTEVVGNCGVVFNHGNVNSLCKVLKKLLASSEYVEKIRSLTCKYVLTKFDWDEITTQTLELYKGRK